MILFADDWFSYPDAVLQLSTTNKSFARMAGLYKEMGVRNHAWPLALLDPVLNNVDPFNVDSAELMERIILEVRNNPIYYFREVAKVPPKAGTNPVQFRANRANLGMYWLFFNHITTFLVQPRQTGKSLSSAELMRGLLSFWVNHTLINHVTKSDTLRMEIVASIKEIESYLPPYLKTKTKKDTNNTETVSVKILDNLFKAKVGNVSKKLATLIGRGSVSPITWFDEVPFINNVQVIVPAALAAGTAAREEAKASNQPWGTLFTTTAGDLTTEEGRFAHSLFSSGMPFTEKLFDTKDELELNEVVRKNSRGPYELVSIEMNHRQLGYTDDWLRNAIKKAMSTGADAKRDFLNQWASSTSSSIISIKDANRIKNSETQPLHVDIDDNGYALSWYIDRHEIEKYFNEPIVASIDSSEAIGKDEIAVTLLDPLTASILAAQGYNDTNTITFSKYLFNLIMKFKNIVFIIERRSTAASIIDNLILLCQAQNIDPFKHIFNWVVNDAEEKPERFKEINLPLHKRDEEVYVKYRKDFGFATSGSGRTSRTGLYGETFASAVKYAGSVVHDKHLSHQIRSLVKKNGRIDHKNSDGDDMVIAWLLGYWFLSNAKNVSFYGHNSSSYLAHISLNEAGIADELEKKKQMEEYERGLKEINDLMTKLRGVTDRLVSHTLAIRIKQRMRQLKIEEKDALRIDQEIEKLNNRKTQRIHTLY